jgi:hypothetical protein
MDSLHDILTNKDFSLPDEIRAIKTYVAKNYNQDVGVSINHNEVVISSRSAGLINNLRSNGPALAKAANTAKKIRFKIG